MKSKINIQEITIENLKNFLITNMQLGHMIPSGKEFTCRCPFCGDSRSDQFTTSFYINMDPSSEQFLLYHCFRANCGANGIVNDEFFDIIGYNDRKTIKDINEYLNTKSVNVGGKYRSRTSKQLYNAINTQSKVSEKKLHYINKRLGLNLGYQDLYDLKINLSMAELLKMNEITVLPDREFWYSKLNDYGIAFISAYNDYLIIRDVSKSNLLGKRYTNVNIFDKYDNVTKAYCIPAEIDLISPEPTVINISEGAFDIISIKYNLNIDRKYPNQIFLAACGSNLISTIKSYIEQYGLINCRINIFSDSDVKKEKYNPLYKLKPYLQKFDVTVYYNDMKGEKDFGVPKERIKIIKSKL